MDVGSKVLGLTALIAWAAFMAAGWASIVGEPWARHAWGVAFLAFASGAPIAFVINQRKIIRHALQEVRKVREALAARGE